MAGRPSKGERGAIMARPPAEFDTILKQKAKEQGLHFGDYLVALAAQALDMPQFAPRSDNDRANELSSTKEAPPRAA